MQSTEQEPKLASQDAEAEQETVHVEKKSTLTVVGIGASAGGLSALQTFFDALPADTGMVFVVVVHLSPEHESVLADLLQRHSEMPVRQVTTRVEMQPNHVYVIPPGKRLVVSGDSLDLAEPDRQRGQRWQIDTFFRSLAEDHSDGAAIILSGTGSDGAVGLQSIKENNGLILVQSPDEAEYDGMPRSAIATGLVDVVAPVAKLATQLVGAKRTGASLELPQDPAQLPQPLQQTLSQILSHLHVRTGHDFSDYKGAMLLRRIGRRLQLNQIPTLTAYLQRLRQYSDEVEALHRDLLIHVTEFFRDPEAWETLAETAIPQIFAGKTGEDSVRVWTVGCATGEEAYSAAMLLLEHAATLDQPPQIQIFASDLGAPALEFARAGNYPGAIADNVPAERLQHFFVQEDSHYRVRPEVRERVLFTQHNLLQDPPFSKLDLILCRNLLIYLQRPLQERIFDCFYYALHPEGYLFLGSAESAEGVTDLFETVHKRHRIYRRSQQDKDMLVLPSLPLLPRSLRAQAQEEAAPERARAEADQHRLLLEEIGLPSLLVDEQQNVLHFSETAGRYLQHPGGLPTNHVVQLVRPELQSELRTALHHAYAQQTMARTRPVPVQFNGAPSLVSILVRLSPARKRALLVFLEGEASALETAPAQESAGEGDQVKQLQAELHHVQHQFQTAREEYETTLEELRAANEELQSTNEEYRSTLEELKTSKEELQSINEELQTVNQEMKNKAEEINRSHSDLQNLFAATEIATLFLDRELRIKRYTPRAGELFNLMPLDRDRPISHLRANLDYQALEADAYQVLSTLSPIEREVQGGDGRWFLVGMRPYFTVEDKIDGVVITFVDITASKESELALRDAKEYAESIIDTVPDSLLVLQTDLRVKTANHSFYRTFRVQPEEIEGRCIYELGNGQWNIPELRTLLEEILPQNNVLVDYEVEHNFEGIGRRTVLLNGRQLDHAQQILLSVTDITERKQAEESLRASARYQALVHATMNSLYRLSGDGTQLLEVYGSGLLPQVEGVQPSLSWLADYFHPDDQVMIREAWTAAISAQTPFTMEHRGRRADGSWGWMLSRAVPVQNDAGAVVKWIGSVTDITDRKQAEASLRKAQESLALALEAAQLGTWDVDLTTNTVRTSLRHNQIFGYTEAVSQWSPQIFRDHILREDREKFDASFVRAMESGELDIEVRVRWPDGSIHWIHDLGRVYYAEDGVPVRMAGVTLDVTERKEAQVAEIRRHILQGLEAERTHLAREIHDGPVQELAALTFEITALSNKLDDEYSATELAAIKKKIERITAAMRYVMVALRPPAVVDFGLAAAIQRHVEELRRGRQEPEFEVEVDEALPSLPEEVVLSLYRICQQALYNVIAHAEAKQVWVRLHANASELLLEVEDDGSGFELPEQWVELPLRRRLGIVGMIERAEAIGGRLEIKSAPGQGARVRAVVPMRDAETQVRLVQSHVSTAAPGPGRLR